jgi:hypothetical protein
MGALISRSTAPQHGQNRKGKGVAALLILLLVTAAVTIAHPWGCPSPSAG